MADDDDPHVLGERSPGQAEPGRDHRRFHEIGFHDAVLPVLSSFWLKG